MPFKYRLIIIIFFIFIFVISTPAIILYSQGYRYDFKRHLLTKTGNFLIESTPSEAFVFINDKPLIPRWYQQLLIYKKILGLTKLRSTTPTAISHLLPDKYQITIKKSGYHPWQKKLDIQPEKTTNLGKIFLFLEQPAIKLLIKEKIDFLYLLAREKKLIYSIYNPPLKNSQIKLVSLTEISQNSIATINGRVLKIEEFLPYLIVYNSESKIFIINLSTSEIINLNNFFKNPIKTIYYGNLFYIQSNNIIYSFDLKNKQIRKILNLKDKNFVVQDWLIKNNNLFLLKKTSDGFYLQKIKLNLSAEKSESEESIYLTLPNYQFEFYPQLINNNLIILKAVPEFFIIDLNQKNNPIIFKGLGKEILIRPEDKKLLYYNNFEIILAEITQDPEGQIKIKEELINRGSQILNQVIWHPSNTYLIFTNKEGLWAIEINGLDKRNTYKLLSDNKIRKIWSTNNPQYLYLWAEINNQEGIWQIQIQ
jgi:hypothetical protein